MLTSNIRRIFIPCVQTHVAGPSAAILQCCVRTSVTCTSLSSHSHSTEQGQVQSSPSWIRYCASAADIESLGYSLAAFCGAGDVLMLRGDLGAGKTTLARGLLREKLQEPELRVTSPSYLLDNMYTCEGEEGGMGAGLTIHHLDLYRLPTGCDMGMLGIPAIFSSALCLVEWPQRLPTGSLPLDYLDIELRIGPGPGAGAGAGEGEEGRGGQGEKDSETEGRVIRITPSSVKSKWSSLLRAALGDGKTL